MKKNILILLLIVIFINSCSNEDYFEGTLDFVNEDKTEEQRGEIKKGFKTGEWKYLINNRKFSIFWRLESLNKFKVNIPANWELYKNENTVYCVNGPVGSDLGQISVLFNDEMSKSEYLENFKLRTDIKDNITFKSKNVMNNSIAFEFLSFVSHDEIPFYQYSIVVNKFESDGVIEFIYNFKDPTLRVEHLHVFLDFISNFNYNNKFLIPHDNENKSMYNWSFGSQVVFDK